MATNFYRFENGVNLGSLGADPGTAQAGDVYFNTGSNTFRAYDGTIWEDIPMGSGFANTALSNLTNPTAINQDLLPDTNLTYDLGTSTEAFNDIYAGRIVDSTGVQSFDITNRVITDPSGQQSLRGDNRILSSTGPVFSVDWQNRILYDNTGVASSNWQNRTTSASDGSVSFDWNSRISFDNGGTNSILWNDRQLFGLDNAIRLAWGGANLDIYRSILPDTDDVHTLGSSSSRMNTIFTNQISSDGGDIIFLGGADFQNLYQIINVVDPVNPQDVATKNYVDSASTGANQTLSNLTSPTAINQDLRPGITNNNELGSSSFQWGAIHVGSLVRNGNQRFNLTTGQLIDSSGQTSIHLDNRNLQDSSGNIRMNWSATETIFTGNVRPVANVTASLGTSSFQWGAVNSGSFLSTDTSNANNILALQKRAVQPTLFPNTATSFLVADFGTGTGALPLALVTQVDSSANADPTMGIEILTGGKTGGTGNSGPITLRTGTSSGGTRGQIILDGIEINASSTKIINVTDPTSAQHAATKAYVDANGYTISTSGSRGTPNNITAGGGITASAVKTQMIFVQGSGGAVTITASPAVTTAGMTVGNIAYIIGRNGTNALTLNNQSGNVELNGSITLGASDILKLIFDGTAWVEVSRSN